MTNIDIDAAAAHLTPAEAREVAAIVEALEKMAAATLPKPQACPCRPTITGRFAL